VRRLVGGAGTTSSISSVTVASYLGDCSEVCRRIRRAWQRSTSPHMDCFELCVCAVCGVKSLPLVVDTDWFLTYTITE
jgi:hypothetical protein